MEAIKIIKTIVAYLIFVVAATFFFYQMIVLSTAMYIDPGEDLNSYLILNVYRPLMYVVFSLCLMLVTQFAVISKGDNKYIESLLYMVLFGVGFVVSVFVLVKGIVSIPNNKISQDASYLYLTIIPLMGVCLAEVIYGFLLYLGYKKIKKAEKEKKEEERLEQDGIKLTKE